VVERAEKVEVQDQNRIRFRDGFPTLKDRYPGAITLADGVTTRNAFPDRGFKPFT
jgi:hypothetical protein